MYKVVGCHLDISTFIWHDPQIYVLTRTLQTWTMKAVSCDDYPVYDF